MAKIKVRVGKPIKAGSSNTLHGGFPTQKILMILKNYNKGKNG